jgi:hypothetical protein
MQEMAITNHPLVVEMVFRQIKKAIRTFEFYPQYKKEIELMLNPKKIIQIKTEARFDLFEGWKLKKSDKKIAKKEFVSNKKVSEKLKKKNLSDEVAQQLALPYNGDRNISAYAAALENRMLGLGWNPKFRYYLFGMKEGINSPIAGLRDGKCALGQTLVKSEGDKSAITNTVKRMADRGADMWTRDTEVDPTRGLVFDERPIVAFGIPASWRGDRITKTGKVLEMIWDIEKKAKFTELCVPDRKETEETETNEAEKALNAPDNSINVNEYRDNSSQGAQLAMRAIRELNSNNGQSLVPREEVQEIHRQSLEEVAERLQQSINIRPGDVIVNFR